MKSLEKVMPGQGWWWERHGSHHCHGGDVAGGSQLMWGVKQNVQFAVESTMAWPDLDHQGRQEYGSVWRCRTCLHQWHHVAPSKGYSRSEQTWSSKVNFYSQDKQLCPELFVSFLHPLPSFLSPFLFLSLSLFLNSWDCRDGQHL